MLFPENFVKVVNLALDFPSNIAMDIVGAERVYNILELSDFHEQIFYFFGDIVQRIFNQSFSDDEVECVQMHDCQFVDIFYLQLCPQHLQLFLDDAMKEVTLESV